MNMFLSQGFSTSKDFIQKLADFFDMYNLVFRYAGGFLSVTSLFIFIYHLVTLYFNADNPTKRRESIKNAVISGLIFAAISSISLFIIFFKSITVGLL